MIRKLFVIAAAIAMPVGLIAATGGVAGAATTGPAAADSIVCHHVSGTLSFNRPLTTAGYTSGDIVTTVHATVSDCTVGGTYHVTVTQGTTTGTLTSATGTHAHPIGKCASLAVGSSTETGTLSTAWNASALTAYPSKVPVKSDLGGTHGSYGTFTLPGSTRGGPPSGSFGGSAKTGSADKSVAQTSLTAGTIIHDCASGVHSLAITTDSAEPAVSLNS